MEKVVGMMSKEISISRLRSQKRGHSLIRISLLLAILASLQVRGENWPQWRGPARDGVWRETGIVSELPSQLTVRWRTQIGQGYSGPAVVGDRLYVSDLVTGRTLQTSGSPDRTTSQSRERVLCLDARTGEILWQHEYPTRYDMSYPQGPRATPTVHQGKVYALGGMGDLLCLDAGTGKVHWSRNYIRDYGAQVPVWGFAAAPLVEGRHLILIVGGTENRCVLALDKDTGREIWRALQAEEPGYSAPVIIPAGGVRQLIIWNPKGLYSLDPETGRIYWSQEFAVRNGLTVATPIFDVARNLLFVSAFYDGPLMLQTNASKPAATLLWRGKSDSELETDGLHSLMCTPVMDAGYLYGVDSYGQLRGLDALRGRRLWETLRATGKGRWWNAFLVRHRERFIICNEQGEIIFAHLSPQGYRETSRTHLIQPTLPVRRRLTVWSHPAFANRSIYARNDREILCADLSAR